MQALAYRFSYKALSKIIPLLSLRLKQRRADEAQAQLEVERTAIIEYNAVLKQRFNFKNFQIIDQELLFNLEPYAWSKPILAKNFNSIQTHAFFNIEVLEKVCRIFDRFFVEQSSNMRGDTFTEMQRATQQFSQNYSVQYRATKEYMINLYTLVYTLLDKSKELFSHATFPNLNEAARLSNHKRLLESIFEAVPVVPHECNYMHTLSGKYLCAEEKTAKAYLAIARSLLKIFQAQIKPGAMRRSDMRYITHAKKIVGLFQQSVDLFKQKSSPQWLQSYFPALR